MTNTLKKLALVGVLALSACGGDKKPEVKMEEPVSLENEVKGITAGTQEDLNARAGSTVYFGYDQSNLTMEATNILKKQVAWLKMFPKVNVTIEGHCDERGTRKYNQALGEKRANATKRYLVAQGISAKRIKTVSYGKDKPAVLGNTDADHAKNRRDVTVVAK